MRKLKIILQSNVVYYLLILIIIILYIFKSYFPYKTEYNDFNNKVFIATKIYKKEYGLKLELKGKEKVLAYLYNKNITILPGDKITIYGKRKEISNNTVPNTFNYKKYLISDKIYNIIEITSVKKIVKSKNLLYILKNKIIGRTNKIEKSYSYINSLILGNNSYMDDDILDSYRDNGISHLFAISGLHIAIFLFIIKKLLSLIKINDNKKDILYISFLVYFLFITNYTVSAVRASIFTILLIINKKLDLNIKTKNILFLTLFIICLNNPLALNNIGLQYSFVVTLSLVLVKDKIKGKYLSRVLSISYIAFFASLPITISNFYQINFMSIIYNIFFVPVISFIIVPLVLITYIFPVLDSFLYFLIKIIERISQQIEVINIGKISVCKTSCIVYMSYYVAYFIIICKIKKVKTYMLFLLLILIFISNIWKIMYSNQIIVFDVEQGDSALVILNNNNILIDTGGKPKYNDSKSTYKFTKNRIIPYLKSVGICQIDTLLLTHGDADHMGEAKYLVENFTVKRVIFNVGELNTLEKDLIKILEEKNVKYYQNINELKVDDTKFYFLNTKEYDNENDNSNVIYFEFNNKKFLFMGDAGIEREKDILEKYNISNLDVLKVGHHGSNTSSSKEFIDRMNSKYSVISVGKNNRYGHPNKEVLENLKVSKIYRTDIDGSIMFRIKNNKLRIETCSP